MRSVTFVNDSSVNHPHSHPYMLATHAALAKFLEARAAEYIEGIVGGRPASGSRNPRYSLFYLFLLSGGDYFSRAIVGNWAM